VRSLRAGLLGALLSAPSLAVPLTVAWDASPSWPSGTTVEVCANSTCAVGITATSALLDAPILPGARVLVQARAVALSGELSPWAELAATWPDPLTNATATKTLLDEPLMTIARRGTTNYSAQGENVASFTLTKEPSVQVGDILLVGASGYSEGVGAGGGVTITGFTKIVDTDMNGNRGTVLWRVVDGTEGASFSVVISGTTARYGSAVLVAFSGNGLSIDTSSSTYNGASVTSLVAPSLDAAVANEMLVNFFLFSDPASFTPPSGADGSFANNPQSTNSSAVSWDAVSASGATGTRTATIGTARTAASASVLIRETGASVASLPLLRGGRAHYAHLLPR